MSDTPSEPTTAQDSSGPETPSSVQNVFLRYGGILAVPVLLWGLVIVALSNPLGNWINDVDSYDRSALTEWLEEARSPRKTLPRLVSEYLSSFRSYAELKSSYPEPNSHLGEKERARKAVSVGRHQLEEHLQALGVPLTKIYNGQLPLFPTIFRIKVEFHGTPLDPIEWDSGLSTHPTQYQTLAHEIQPGVRVTLNYQLHAYNKRQRLEQQQKERVWLLLVLAAIATMIAVGWLVYVQVRERERETKRAEAERQALDAERRREETERKLLEEQVALQAAKQEALELSSQLYANIGIMAASYAHNIKNLLVRPNDLLARCLEDSSLSEAHSSHLGEIRRTLGTVTERLQQILRTIRRDPGETEVEPLNVAEYLEELRSTWSQLAEEKWQMEIVLEPPQNADELWIEADLSHLQQATENLVFNARDAVFEMRRHLWERTNSDPTLSNEERREAKRRDASWIGRLTLRTRVQGDRVIVELSDNGIGMTDEVRRQCTATHFTTKRDNALFEGFNTGMGLGLSFVSTVLKKHGAELEIDSAPHEGTTFRLSFERLEERPSVAIQSKRETR